MNEKPNIKAKYRMNQEKIHVVLVRAWTLFCWSSVAAVITSGQAMTVIILQIVVIVYLTQFSDCGESPDRALIDEYAPEFFFQSSPENRVGHCYDRSFTSVRDDYYSEEGNPNSFVRRNSRRTAEKCEIFPKKPFGGENPIKIVKPDKQLQNPMLQKRNLGLRSLFQSTIPLPCSCETNYRLQDLGHIYFPRYLPTAECKPLAHWNPLYSCQDKFYKVQVLRKRKVGEEEPEDYNMPESLRRHWVVELQSVTVACECTT